MVNVKLGFLTFETGFNPMVIVPGVTDEEEYTVMLRYVDGPAPELVFYKAEGYLLRRPVVLGKGMAWIVAPAVSKDTGPIDIIGFYPSPGAYILQVEVYRYGEREPTLTKKYRVAITGPPAQHRLVDPFSPDLYSKDMVIQAKGVIESGGEYYVVTDILDKKNNVKYSFPYRASSLVVPVDGKVELSPIALQTMLQIKELHKTTLELEIAFKYEFDVPDYLRAIFAGNPREYFKQRTEEEVRKQLEKQGIKVLEVEVVDLKLDIHYKPREIYPDHVKVDSRVRIVVDVPAVPVWLIALAIVAAIAAIIGFTVAVTVYSQAMKEQAYYGAIEAQARVQEEYWESWAEYLKAYEEWVKSGRQGPPPKAPPEEPPKLPPVKPPSPTFELPEELESIFYMLIAIAVIIAVIEVIKSFRS